MRKLTHIVLFAFLLSSCQKFNPGDCFTNSGALTEETREMEAFTYLQLYNNVDVYLSYGPEYALSVRAGKNIMAGIKTEVSGKSLSIKNENTCNWVRSYDKPIEVYISAPRIDSIQYQASGNLVSLNKFIGDSLKLDVLEGAGSIDLTLDMQRTILNLHYGTVDMKVSGYAHISELFSSGYGPADLSGLNTVFTYVTNNSTNNCYVRSNLVLEAKIGNVGDIYYSGNPPNISFEVSGTGKLIPQ